MQISRNERLMNARVELNKAKFLLTDATTDRIIEAADYLFCEIGILIGELEDLKRQVAEKGTPR